MEKLIKQYKKKMTILQIVFVALWVITLPIMLFSKNTDIQSIACFNGIMLSMFLVYILAKITVWFENELDNLNK